MNKQHEWKVDDSTGQLMWVCTQCGAATNNAFLASLPRECPGETKGRGESMTLETLVDTFIFSALEEIGSKPLLVLPEDRHRHLRSIMLRLVEDRWMPFSEKKPESGLYFVYHPAGDSEGCHYGECVDIAFYDADDDVCYGGYHGPIAATHWKKKPEGPKLNF